MSPAALSDFHPFDPAVLEDPWEFNRRLRREAPVYRDPHTGIFLVSRDVPIVCWSAMIVAPVNVNILAWNIQGATFMNYAAPPQFNVCFTEPMVLEQVTHLLTFYCETTNDLPGYFYVVGSPIAGEPFSQAPCYVLETDFETPHFLHGYPNGIDEPMFAVNGDISPVAAMTWSGVRNLFE